MGSIGLTQGTLGPNGDSVGWSMSENEEGRRKQVEWLRALLLGPKTVGFFINFGQLSFQPKRGWQKIEWFWVKEETLGFS